MFTWVYLDNQGHLFTTGPTEVNKQIYREEHTDTSSYLYFISTRTFRILAKNNSEYITAGNTCMFAGIRSAHVNWISRISGRVRRAYGPSNQLLGPVNKGLGCGILIKSPTSVRAFQWYKAPWRTKNQNGPWMMWTGGLLDMHVVTSSCFFLSLIISWSYCLAPILAAPDL